MSTTELKEVRATSVNSAPHSCQNKKMPSGEAGSENQEDERTLTDHLNKKLLQSFLARMESGIQVIPPLPHPAQPQVEEQNFDD